MATSQMIAAATSGRYMSDFAKSVSPALKLMNVLTTATEASEMPVAAGIPSSRTRPDVCRMKRRPDSGPPAVAVPAAASLLATAYRLYAKGERGFTHGDPDDLVTPRLTQWLGSDKSLSIPTNILLFPQSPGAVGARVVPGRGAARFGWYGVVGDARSGAGVGGVPR